MNKKQVVLIAAIIAFIAGLIFKVPEAATSYATTISKRREQILT